ncbi:MAG: DUF1553 domain-containing protein, partial [Nitrospinae bacterium]|nr:DUF1553 domain-containing protein [Nitrospinota bacterium]
KTPQVPDVSADALSSGKRLAIAKWMFAEDNPLTARVIANRLWKSVFGIGLIEPVDNMFDDEDTNSQIDHLLQEAEEVAESGDLEIALRLYDEIVKISPENAKAQIGMGDCYMKLQLPDNAEACFDQACLIDPNDSKGWLRLGLLALHRSDNKKADICFNKCLDNDPDNDRAFCGLGMVRINRNDLNGAADYFCKSLDSNPENLSACKYLLEISYKLEQFGDIEIYLNKFMELHPANLNMRLV